MREYGGLDMLLVRCLLLSLWLLPGCWLSNKLAEFNERPTPIAIAETTRIETITIVDRRGNGKKHLITEKEKIDQFRQFVNELDSGWYQNWYTFPSFRYLIIVDGEDEEIIRFHFSHGLMGEKYSSGEKDYEILRKLSDQEWEELKIILAIEDDVDANQESPQ